MFTSLSDKPWNLLCVCVCVCVCGWVCMICMSIECAYIVNRDLPIPKGENNAQSLWKPSSLETDKRIGNFISLMPLPANGEQIKWFSLTLVNMILVTPL